MKDLLDKEMPVQTGVGWGKRRIIGYFAGLMLLTTAGVGGYRYYMNHQPGIYVSGGAESESYSDPSVTPEVISLTMPARDARSAAANGNSGGSTIITNAGAGNSALNSRSAAGSNQNVASNSSNSTRLNSNGSTRKNQKTHGNSQNRVVASSNANSVNSNNNWNSENSRNTNSQLLSTRSEPTTKRPRLQISQLS
jgi:hypothetical protein